MRGFATAPGRRLACFVLPHTPSNMSAQTFESESPRWYGLTPACNVMNSASQGDRSQPKLLRAAIASGFIAAIVTAGAVSWSTPDGNLVVTLAPALAVGLAVFGLVLRRTRRGESE